ncbi:MAG: hypothetical protein E6Q97_17900 [Desulfurellales bacterium]|nr:MAG: hypothetical protein E6Q97_17900 [Desulfurellales bacterium]
MPSRTNMPTVQDARSGPAASPLDRDMSGNFSTGAVSTGLDYDENMSNALVSTYVYIGGGASNAQGVSTPLANAPNVGLTEALPTSAPNNTVAPAITGTPTVGSTLTTTNGTWTGTPTPTYTRAWYANNVVIANATGLTYVLTASEAGKTIKCVVTATNTAGTADAQSNVTAVVT